MVFDCDDVLQLKPRNFAAQILFTRSVPNDLQPGVLSLLVNFGKRPNQNVLAFLMRKAANIDKSYASRLAASGLRIVKFANGIGHPALRDLAVKHLAKR